MAVAGVAVFVGVGVVVLGNMMKNRSGGVGGLLAGLGSNDMAEYTGASEFKNGFATVNCDSDMFSYCVIDEDFKIRYTFSGQDVEMRDGWTVYKEFGGTEQYDVVNPEGKVVYSYKKSDDFKFQLVDRGCAIITERGNSYNSSETKTGVYDLAEGKYILEPSEEYNEAEYGGDNMVFLKKNIKDEKGNYLPEEDRSRVYFNLISHGKITTMVGNSDNLFVDGYMINKKGIYHDDVTITDGATGSTKVVNVGVSAMRHYSDFKNYTNGMYFATLKNYPGDSIILNLKTGKVVDLKEQFTGKVNNMPEYINDGYALVDFNNPGGKTYYAVIDREGKMAFDPVSAESGVELKSGNLSEDGYFVTKEGDEYQARNYKNEIVYRVTGEKISGVTNGTAIVGPDEITLAGISASVYRIFSGETVKLERTAETKDL